MRAKCALCVAGSSRELQPTVLPANGIISLAQVVSGVAGRRLYPRL